MNHPEAAALVLCESYARFVRAVMDAHGHDVVAVQGEFQRAKKMMDSAAEREIRR
jgi:hypothetical protein